MSVSLSLDSESSNNSNKSLITLQEDYFFDSNCKKCAFFLSKCNAYKKLIKKYKRRQIFVRIFRVLLFMIVCWIVYRLYQMFIIKKQNMQIYELFKN